jgi:hypothetical protein
VKLQYLGDSRDSFKWHYHDYLMNHNRNAGSFGYIPMLRPDNGTSEGNTSSYDYKGSKESQDFCNLMRASRDISNVHQLPVCTKSTYRVSVLKPETYYKLLSRDEYYKSYFSANIVLVDPCNGFEPQNATDNHVLYEDIAYYIHTLPKRAVFSIYQHFRRKKFTEDFMQIRSRLRAHNSLLNTTAICWRSDVMFVQVSVSKEEVRNLNEINQRYASQNKGVYVLQ